MNNKQVPEIEPPIKKKRSNEPFNSIIYRRTRYHETKERVNKYKLARGCDECGYNHHPVALDFDHKPGEIKTASVSRLMGASNKRIMEEIDKCDLLCANCHRIRTFERKDMHKRHGRGYRI